MPRMPDSAVPQPSLYTPLCGHSPGFSLLLTEKWLMRGSVLLAWDQLSVFSTTDTNFVQFKDLINTGVSGSSFRADLSSGIKDDLSLP